MPVIESLSEEFAEQVRFAVVHVDRDGKVLEQLEASGLPTYILFRDGVEIDRLLPLPWWVESRMRRMLRAGLR